jgi:hypothetical protein
VGPKEQRVGLMRAGRRVCEGWPVCGVPRVMRCRFPWLKNLLVSYEFP